MRFNLLTRQLTSPDATPGGYADLDALLRLQAKASGFSFLPRQPIHSLLAGRHASRLRGRGLNFEEIRAYLPGDDIRNMDWKVTARVRKPHVRVFTEERDRPALLMVDQRMRMFFGSQRCMKAVVAAEATALAAWRILSVGDRVGAVVFNDTDIVDLTPHRSRQRVVEILHAVVSLNHRLDIRAGIQPNPDMFNAVLERTRRLAKHDWLVVLIGDGDGANDESVRLVTQLSEHNDTVAVFIYDPLEAELPDAGRLVLGAGEQQLEINTMDRHLSERFQADFQQRLDWFRHVARQREMPLLPISTAEDVAVQVRRLLGEAIRS
jgi:uncharacterized protein (DUF58 family)